MSPPLPDDRYPAPADAGFTLLEVLAAVAVAGLLLSAIGVVVGVTMAGIRSAPDRVALGTAGRSLLSLIPEGDALRLGTTTGTLDAIRYQMVVTPAPGLVPAPRSQNGATAQPGWTAAAVTITARTPAGRALRLDTVRLMRPSAS